MMPSHFASPESEYAAATTAAAMFDFSGRSLIELTGTDRVRFLHGFCTNDVKRLQPGEGCEAFVTNVKGKVVGHVWIEATPSSIWLSADAGAADRIVSHLSRYIINEDVTVSDRSADWAELLVMGPQAEQQLRPLGVDVTGLSNLGNRALELEGAPARVRRFDVGPHSGYGIALPLNQLANWVARVGAAGSASASTETWNALRIEAGLPVYGVDISDDNLTQEVGRTKTAISFTKGCYLGQEPIARLDAMGHVNRELRSLRLAGEAVPRLGSKIWADAAASQPAGTVTSAAFSWGSRSPVAMGLLRSAVTATGTRHLLKPAPRLCPQKSSGFPETEARDDQWWARHFCLPVPAPSIKKGQTKNVCPHHVSGTVTGTPVGRRHGHVACGHARLGVLTGSGLGALDQRFTFWRLFLRRWFIRHRLLRFMRLRNHTGTRR